MTELTAEPVEILEGASVSQESCTATCAQTGATLREGDRVIIHVDRHTDVSRWGTRGIYAADTANRFGLHGRSDTAEILAEARLAVASDMATQSSRLVLHDVKVLNTRQVGDPLTE